jgi:hypothetical protein
MATCYNPLDSKKPIIIINTICENKNVNTSPISELIKDWFGNYDLPNNIDDITKNKNSSNINTIKYIQNIIKILNKEDTNEKIYWDIEAQKFLIE